MAKSTLPARTRTPHLVLGVYLLVLALIVFWPSHVDKPLDGWLDDTLQFLHEHGIPGWVDYVFVESASNVVLFIPFGFLIASMLPPRRWWAAVIIGCAASCCIELAQLLFLSGRTASVADVAVNTLGAAIGAVIAWLVRRTKRRTPSQPSSAETYGR
ncbi:VanZ family protein [Arthrobacter sp. H14-L1]|uniref:VanZ family protein n=1 Tax=Arthrobacter sp. H14-L1 TaxID=2996697 RepID=UPI00226F3BEA|nr:VanZ family protein [Arthrobacter sp. H14-L1]MCY0905477.1 VanZ family protein [Arthrobacter sp. H14-L1]